MSEISVILKLSLKQLLFSGFHSLIVVLNYANELRTSLLSCSRNSSSYMSLSNSSEQNISSCSPFRELKSPIKINLELFVQYIKISPYNSVKGSSFAYFEPMGGIHTTPQYTSLSVSVSSGEIENQRTKFEK